MAGKGKGALRIAIEDFFDTFQFGKILNNWFRDWGETQEYEISQHNQDLMKMITEIDGLPEAFKKLATMKPGDQSQGGILTAGGFASQVGQSMAGGILQPAVNHMNYAMEHLLHSSRPDIQTLIEAERRGFVHPDTVKRVGSELGWDGDSRELFYLMSIRLLGATDLITLWRRKEITEEELHDRLLEQSFDDRTIAELKTITEVIPGIGDLINMTVREAFNDGIAQKFGYDDDFPSGVVPFAEAQGLTQDWVKKFWRAHWSLPSVGQGFEMLHRLRPGLTDTPFTKDDLNDLLRILDIPTYWRDRLTQVSYSPLTRVDVRRMHDMGILDREGVKNAYLDAGYNDENAELMTDFTEQFNQDEQKTLSRSVVERAFKKGLLSEAEAVELLQVSGYNQEQADFYISIYTFDMLEKETDLETDLIDTLYQAGEITKSEANNKLTGLNIPETQIQTLLKQWELKKLKSVKLPTESELETWYKLDYISADDYRAGLVDKNYQAETLDLYIRQADQDIAESLQKQERDLLKAKEQLQLDLTTSAYRLSRADLDVRIAQEKANIAELKLLAHDIEEPEVLDQLKTRIDLIRLVIADLNVQKAELKLGVEEELSEEAENE